MKSLTHSTILALLAAAVITATPAFADLIQLKDGRTISGTMSRGGDLMHIRADDGTTLSVKPDDVVAVTLTSAISPARAADAAWTKTTADMRRAEDLASAIALVEKFLQEHGEQPVAATARKQLEEFKTLAAQNAVKWRGRWVPAQQVEVMLRIAEEKARPSVEAYKAGRIKEALEQAREALKQDEENTTALAIAGLASYRSNQLMPARQYFGKLGEVDESSVFAHNNYAVVSAQQKAESLAAVGYTRALAANPNHRLVLDNIAEFLNSYYGSKTSTTYKDLVRQFEQAETRMQGVMAKEGLFRYGSSWLKKEDFEKVQARRNGIITAMEQLDANYKDTQNKLAAAEADLRATSQSINTVVADLNYLNALITGELARGGDVTGLILRRDALNVEYDRLINRKKAMDKMVWDLKGALTLFPAEAEKLKSALSRANATQFTGVQRIMELGDAAKVPAPVPVTLKPEAPPLSIPPAPGPGVRPVVEDRTPLEDYHNIITPIGYSWLPPVIIIQPPQPQPPGNVQVLPGHPVILVPPSPPAPPPQPPPPTPPPPAPTTPWPSPGLKPQPAPPQIQVPAQPAPAPTAPDQNEKKEAPDAKFREIRAR